MAELIVRSMALGMASANCYFVYYEGAKECLLIDAPGESERIVRAIEALELKAVAVLLTHSHFDHIGAAEALREKYNIPICCHEAEKDMLADPGLNLTAMVGRGYGIKPDRTFADGENVSLAGFEFKVIHTPGHTQGGACYYFEKDKKIFCGDTLFCESVGRTDFPTGSSGTLISSIKDKLFILPEDTTVYPGHNESTTIGHEKKYNEYVGGF